MRLDWCTLPHFSRAYTEAGETGKIPSSSGIYTQLRKIDTVEKGKAGNRAQPAKL